MKAGDLLTVQPYTYIYPSSRNPREPRVVWVEHDAQLMKIDVGECVIFLKEESQKRFTPKRCQVLTRFGVGWMRFSRLINEF